MGGGARTMSNQFQGSLKKGAARVAAMLSSSSREKATAKKKSALANMRSWSAVVAAASCAWYSCAAAPRERPRVCPGRGRPVRHAFFPTVSSFKEP